MSKQFYRIPDDGALFPCRECGERKVAHEVILPVDEKGKPLEFGVLCLDCVDAQWLEGARDLGLHREG
jgi:hypothetical protein